MRHSFIDRYSGIDSYVHRLDPRIKIIGFFAIILSIVLTRPESFITFSLYALLIAVLILLSKIPLNFIFRKSLAIIPFVLLICIFIPFFKKGEIAGVYSLGTWRIAVTHDGLKVFWNILIKSYLSTLSMILLMASTQFPNFLKALERLRMPYIFIMILSFMYRYIFVLQDELLKMKQAKEARSVGGSKWIHTKALANMVGVLFIRAYERAENIYLAMCSRGFNGNIRTINNFQIKTSDLYFLYIIAGFLIGIRFIEV